MKTLLGLTVGTILLSSVAMAQEAKPEMPNDMAPPPPMADEMRPGAPEALPKADAEKLEKRMKAHKERFEKRLNLTPEQKEKIEALHEKTKAEMKPIMDEMKTLREKADAIRENSKKEFEAVLTDEQREILKTMHKERMEKKGPKYDKKMKGDRRMERKKRTRPASPATDNE